MITRKDEDKLIAKMVKFQKELDGVRCPSPHCDSSVLHRPSVCEHCDHYPDFQELRVRWRINFTGENDPEKAPCPATHFRPVETIHRWGGNAPKVTTDLDRLADSMLGKDVRHRVTKAHLGVFTYFDGAMALCWDDKHPGGTILDIELIELAGGER